jgi:hypothetical protein
MEITRYLRKSGIPAFRAFFEIPDKQAAGTYNLPPISFMPLATGTKLDHYEILSGIGSGGMDI